MPKTFRKISKHINRMRFALTKTKQQQLLKSVIAFSNDGVNSKSLRRNYVPYLGTFYQKHQKCTKFNCKQINLMQFAQTKRLYFLFFLSDIAFSNYRVKCKSLTRWVYTKYSKNTKFGSNSTPSILIGCSSLKLRDCKKMYWNRTSRSLVIG
jgi:hypothetical protein